MSREKKVVVKTGTSSGIGAGILQAFKDRNYRVVATSRSIKPVADEGLARPVRLILLGVPRGHLRKST